VLPAATPSSNRVRCARTVCSWPCAPIEILIRVEGRLGQHHVEPTGAHQRARHGDDQRGPGRAGQGGPANPQVAQILIDGAGERGLCAGGDIRLLYDGIRGEAIAPPTFWADEYRMNSELAHFGKPIVAYMEGITLGGGVGISGHCSIRIVTETSQVVCRRRRSGWPRTVGGLYLLPERPANWARTPALTGARLGAADAISAGLADRFLPADRLPALTEQLRTHALTSPADIAGLADFREHPPPSTMQFQRDWIAECYAADDVSTILRRLLDHPDPSAQETGEHLSTMSPTSLKVTLAAVRRAASMTLDEVLAQGPAGVREFPAPPRPWPRASGEAHRPGQQATLGPAAAGRRSADEAGAGIFSLRWIQRTSSGRAAGCPSSRPMPTKTGAMRSGPARSGSQESH